MTSRLTRREVQCVRLAGESLSNKEIARRLALSPRTVNNHLSNAYAKLGTSDRFAAAARVARDYPDYSRIAPIPMAALPETAPSRPMPDGGSDGGGREGAPGRTWPLPPPPRGAVRLLLALVIAAVAAILVSGIVFMVTASLKLSAESAPADAVRSI